MCFHKNTFADRLIFFTLVVALYLCAETLKPGLGSHISRPRDILPDFQAEQRQLIIREALGRIWGLQNQQAHKGDNLGFYG